MEAMPMTKKRDTDMPWCEPCQSYHHPGAPGCFDKLARLPPETEARLNDAIATVRKKLADGASSADAASAAMGAPTDRDYQTIPVHCRAGLKRYIESGVRTGDFLEALLSNDLRGTFERADALNVQCIKHYLVFLYNFAPSKCWGSPDRYKEWIAAKGLNMPVDHDA
jgi:hypothetical protein